MSKQIRLTKNRYGKSGVRVLRLDRSATPHRLLEMELDIRLEGSFQDAYSKGDNRRVVPTDTMKNTVYALARETRARSAEDFAIELASHFVNNHEPVTRSSVDAVERSWAPIGGRADAFVAPGAEAFTARVTVDGGGQRVRSGFRDLMIMRTADSGFEDFLVDELTTLQDTDDRIFATRMEALWEYRRDDLGNLDFASSRRDIRQLLIDVFADHQSRSVQHTLYAMAGKVLEDVESVWRVRLSMPNVHYLKANLEPFGLDNPNVVFMPTDAPFGSIEASLERT